MSAQHTAGPWQVAGPCEVTGRYSVIHNGPLFYVSDASQTGDGEANARLAAAAPELLDACRCALADLEGLELDGDDCPAALTIKELRAAIAKATGETL